MLRSAWARALVQDHVVRVAVELLEAQAAGVLLVDLVDRVVQGLPGLVGVLLVHLLVVLEGLDYKFCAASHGEESRPPM